VFYIACSCVLKCNYRFVIKAPPGPPRKDRELSHVIISETKNEAVAKHQVTRPVLCSLQLMSCGFCAEWWSRIHCQIICWCQVHATNNCFCFLKRSLIFTAWCYTECSIAMASRLSVGDVVALRPHWSEYFANNFTVI